MTLLDAKEFDPEKESRKRKRLILGISVIVIILLLGWWFRYWREEHIVGKFFEALQKQDFKTAYAIWHNDPDWQRHPDSKSVHDYPFQDFYRDWGPGGEWGVVKTHSVDCALGTKEGTGVIMQVTVNGRTEHPYLYVDKSDKTMSFSPAELRCGS